MRPDKPLGKADPGVKVLCTSPGNAGSRQPGYMEQNQIHAPEAAAILHITLCLLLRPSVASVHTPTDASKRRMSQRVHSV